MLIDQLQQIDLMVRGGSLALLFLLAGQLWTRHRNSLAARLAVAMLLLIGCHVLATMDSLIRAPLPLGLSVSIGAALVPASFWLFARSWFNDRVRVGWSGWLGMNVALGIAATQVMLTQFAGGSPHIVQALVRLMMISFAIAGLWEAWRGRRDDLIEVRRRLRLGLISAVGLFALLTNTVEIATDQGLLPNISTLALELGILVLCLVFALILLGLKNPVLFDLQNSSDLKSPAFKVNEEGARRVLDHMMANKAWRDETYSIAKLAADLGEREYRLRRLINGQLGFRNFAAFLSSFRLNEVRSALGDPAQRDVPISTIALDAGFGSLGPFNRIFREAEGMTPSEYRARHIG